MPASMGMMMLGRLIMSLVGDRDSWDQQSLMSGMMGGMGGMGMGSMGGGMGGMGGGMGGMGGGMRSVPPTGLPYTTSIPSRPATSPPVWWAFPIRMRINRCRCRPRGKSFAWARSAR